MRSIKEKYQRRNRQIGDLKLKLTPTRRAVHKERKRLKYTFILEKEGERHIDVCIWRMFVFMSVVVTVWGSVGMFVV